VTLLTTKNNIQRTTQYKFCLFQEEAHPSLRSRSLVINPVSVWGGVVFLGSPGGRMGGWFIARIFLRAINDTMGGGGIIYKAAAYQYNSTARAQGKG